MTRSQWERVRDVFERALECEPPADAVWIEGQVPDDPDVRAEVAALLAHHSQMHLFMAQPIGERVPGLLVEEKTFEAGQVVGPYTMVREIGRGGMGRVFLAKDSRLDRTVALKMLPPALARHPAQRERLRREARAAAALTHPGICTVYALEELDGEIFIATEFVDGRTLREEITNGVRPTAREALATATELAAALASAHAAGITHRDLKPENVMRTAGGRLKILDFGLARSAAPGVGPFAAQFTDQHAIVGTPGYMAPEQLNGGLVDQRADVFAFGVLMYEVVTGRHPFAAPTALAVIARVLEAQAPPLDAATLDRTPVLAAVIMRCLPKTPADRFGSAADIQLALDASPLVPSAPTSPWWRIHQVSVVAIYLLSGTLAWLIKESYPGFPDAVFIGVGLLAAAGGVIRGHLVFAASVHGAVLAIERRRGDRITLVTDLAIALALAGDGVRMAADRPLASVLTLALAVGIALGRLVIEPATSRASFGES